jgi:hypothetical protein
MEAAQAVVIAGLTARAAAGIPVRQPLATAQVDGGLKLPAALLELVRDALNVLVVRQSITAATAPVVTLDTHLTDELKVAGLVRKLTRVIQQLRKDTQLQRSVTATVVIGGVHPLDPLLTAALPAVARATTTLIQRSSTVISGAVAVDGLSITLSA